MTPTGGRDDNEGQTRQVSAPREPRKRGDKKKKKKKKRSRQQCPVGVAEAGGQSAAGIEEWKGRKFKMSNLARLAGWHSAKVGLVPFPTKYSIHRPSTPTTCSHSPPVESAPLPKPA
ncbi:hypothetical protein J3459_006472 [Metarhizium acridum]|nr:hypothetical protein J3459_006472 [Metarhizium acridum]